VISFEKGFLRSRVARRIFALFVLCALVPLAALAWFSFSQVSTELVRQALHFFRYHQKISITLLKGRLTQPCLHHNQLSNQVQGVADARIVTDCQNRSEQNDEQSHKGGYNRNRNRNSACAGEKFDCPALPTMIAAIHHYALTIRVQYVPPTNNMSQL